MDFTQNQRLMQITENTLIIGVDIAKRKHVARAIDDRGRDLVKRLVFENTLPGLKHSSKSNDAQTLLLAWNQQDTIG
ncbi:hypothetical protein GCM10012290_07340 [Halolactibacillus alkaliphilus]|uniref:Uncharacterized protein n=1 Tax=Halolactibacillus alkaliphilus TaxID=442899 RepID=A0A511WZI8_9BACI|nr:hypothetical protein HAL01_05760 [Halolactibacillus alkaliphilus]GGN67141.1 hypothetical protein GCM10012290_07340 [Halolactibacillus alkaliphilus]SFO71530.1 hypothetical protein SAMN05720591_10634 [Halolactibacillus alkaliphilus]